MGKLKASIARMSSALLLCHRKKSRRTVSGHTALRFRRGKQQTRAFPTGHFDCSGEIDEEWHSAFRSISLSASSEPIDLEDSGHRREQSSSDLDDDFRHHIFSFGNRNRPIRKHLCQWKHCLEHIGLSSTMIWIPLVKAQKIFSRWVSNNDIFNFVNKRERERVAGIDCDVSFDWQILPDGERSISVTQSIDVACCNLAETSLVNKVPLCHGGGSAIVSRPWWTLKMFTSSSWTRENVVVRFRLSSMEGARITDSLSDYVNKQSFPENSVVLLLCDHQSEPSTKPRLLFHRLKMIPPTERRLKLENLVTRSMDRSSESRYWPYAWQSLDDWHRLLWVSQSSLVSNAKPDMNSAGWRSCWIRRANYSDRGQICVFVSLVHRTVDKGFDRSSIDFRQAMRTIDLQHGICSFSPWFDWSLNGFCSEEICPHVHFDEKVSRHSFSSAVSSEAKTISKSPLWSFVVTLQLLERPSRVKEQMERIDQRRLWLTNHWFDTNEQLKEIQIVGKDQSFSLSQSRWTARPTSEMHSIGHEHPERDLCSSSESMRAVEPERRVIDKAPSFECFFQSMRSASKAFLSPSSWSAWWNCIRTDSSVCENAQWPPSRQSAGEGQWPIDVLDCWGHRYIANQI